jgi:hypothetical protein
MIGRDDPAAAVELEEIAAALPERRYFLRCGRRSRAAGTGNCAAPVGFIRAWRFPAEL